MSNKKKFFWQKIDPYNRFLVSLSIGMIIYLLTVTISLKTEFCFLIAYNLAVLIYLGLSVLPMSSATPEDTMQLAQKIEPSNAVIIIIVNIFSGMGLVAVGLMSNNSKNWTPWVANLHLGLSLCAVFLSWILIHTFFAFHYAYLYYDRVTEEESLIYRKGLDFPNRVLPDYWDFMYYSFTIGMCYQTSDVSVKHPLMRRWTLYHSLVSFLLVLVVLGLVVNILSNLI